MSSSRTSGGHRGDIFLISILKHMQISCTLAGGQKIYLRVNDEYGWFSQGCLPDVVFPVRLKSSTDADGRTGGSTIVTCLIVVVVFIFCSSCSISRSSSLDRDSTTSTSFGQQEGKSLRSVYP